MNASTWSRTHTTRLRTATVLTVQEDACTVTLHGRSLPARYASQFPRPRVERLSPGHLVAVGTAPDGTAVVVWRWYDAVVVADTDDGPVRMWEPTHGEVLARRRNAHPRPQLGTRAYLSAGLPGAHWWVAGAVVADGGTADVELDGVERLYTDNDLWDTVI